MRGLIVAEPGVGYRVAGLERVLERSLSAVTDPGVAASWDRVRCWGHERDRIRQASTFGGPSTVRSTCSMSAVDLVASGGAPSTTVVGLRLTDAVIEIVRPLARGAGRRPRAPVERGRGSGCDVRVRRAEPAS